MLFNGEKMFRIVRFVIIIFIVFALNIVAENNINKTIAVIPFEIIDVSSVDADNLVKKLNEVFSLVPEIDLVSQDTVLAGFRNTSVVKDSVCRNRVCAIAVAKTLGVHYAFIGSVHNVDNTVTLKISAVIPEKNETVWTNEYSSKDDIDNFIKKTSENVVIDARNTFLAEQKTEDVSDGTKTDTAKDSIVSQKTDENKDENSKKTETIPIEENDEPLIYESSVSNHGTVQGLTAGLVGRYVVNDAGFTESEWGIDVFCLIPTTSVSQARFKFALPMSTADTMGVRSTCKRNRDFFFSLEHEWGLKNIGTTVGVGYMYLDNFQKIDIVPVHNATQFNTYNFKTSHIVNWVFGIRAGKHNKGFKGRISYPFFWGDEKNLFIEYSAIGMFGGSRIKGGMGILGAVKKRVGKFSSMTMFSESQSSYFSSRYPADSTNKLREYYFMGPSGRVAFLAGQHSSVTIGLDFMGILVPDILNTKDRWTPNILLGYTFSFGKLTNPETYDGKF